MYIMRCRPRLAENSDDNKVTTWKEGISESAGVLRYGLSSCIRSEERSTRLIVIERIAVRPNGRREAFRSLLAKYLKYLLRQNDFFFFFN